tara:strand:+ start:561 stop:731 length:171 start_codon:yes stop_codon:yes gene_type:complete
MSYNWHSDDFNQKLREHERYMDALMDHHNGEEPEYDPEDLDPEDFEGDLTNRRRPF